jgi:methyl-accepting chemotaxis protein
MKINLSWKQKLLLVIGITIVGFSIVAVSAFVGLRSVEQSVKQQQSAADYKQLSLALAYQLLSIKTSSANLQSPESVGEYLSKIESLISTTQQMKSRAESLESNQLMEYAGKLDTLVQRYKLERKQWLNINDTLGFSDKGGLKRKFLESAKNLNSYTFLATLEKLIFDLAVQQKDYIAVGSEELGSTLDGTLKEIEAVIEEFGWKEDEIGQAVASYRQLFTDISGLLVENLQVTDNIASVTNDLNRIIGEQDIYLQDSVVVEVLAQANNAASTANKTVIFTSLIVGAIVFLSLGAISALLNTQLKTIQKFLSDIASGDFSQKLPTNDNEKDEFNRVRVASNQMVEDISTVISKVVKGNSTLLELREKLEAEVLQLGASSEEVEQKTQQSTTATQQISNAVTNVAKRSVDVSETAQSASEATINGGKVINDCVKSMVSISSLIEKTDQEVSNLTQSSSKMLGIIDVINGLADQTNLLALNAAIESARAGEAGRGFSVVADEVRALAQKTVNATGSIGEIIQNFTDQSKRMGELMAEGIKLAASGQDNANNAMESIEYIENSIDKVAKEMDQVVVAVEDISHNASDIAAQVEHIYGQSEQTKRIRMEMQEHTHQLSAQAKSLGESTSRFKLSS